MDISINGQPCFLSRKQHFHTDLPLEITHLIKDGMNEIHFSLPSISEKEKAGHYFASVERITTQNDGSVRGVIDTNTHTTVEETIAGIKRRLGEGIAGEVVLLGRTMNVSVVDPLSAKICKIPVQGVDCKHMECFDLDNWLSSRPSKPGSATSEPCIVDCWACPLCGGDARPISLRINDYFVNVCKRLLETGRLDAKAIAVSPDATWQPIDSQTNQRPSTLRSPLEQPAPRSRGAAEIIEVSSD